MNCTPVNARTTHATPTTVVPRTTTARCAAAIRVNRSTDIAVRTTTVATRTAASAAAPIAPIRPMDDSRKPPAAPSRIQSYSRLNGRDRTVLKPRSTMRSTVSRPRSTPASTATTRRGRGGRTTSTTTPTAPSMGIRRNEAAGRLVTPYGRTSATNTSTAASTVTVRAMTGRGRRTLPAFTPSRSDRRRRMKIDKPEPFPADAPGVIYAEGRATGSDAPAGVIVGVRLVYRRSPPLPDTPDGQ